MAAYKDVPGVVKTTVEKLDWLLIILFGHFHIIKYPPYVPEESSSEEEESNNET